MYTHALRVTKKQKNKKPKKPAPNGTKGQAAHVSIPQGQKLAPRMHTPDVHPRAKGTRKQKPKNKKNKKKTPSVRATTDKRKKGASRENEDSKGAKWPPRRQTRHRKRPQDQAAGRQGTRGAPKSTTAPCPSQRPPTQVASATATHGPNQRKATHHQGHDGQDKAPG